MTLRYYGNVDELNICYYLKLPFQKPPLRISFHKNIASNDECINNYSTPNQNEFTDKSIMWYLHNKPKKVREYDELWFE